MGDGVNSSFVRLRRGDNFQQTHVARRVEEMRAKPGPAEFVRKAFADLVHRQSTCVGRDNGTGLADGFYFLEQGTFDFEILDYRLNDPIDLGKLFDVIFKIAHANQSSQRRVHECRRLGFLRCFESGGGNLVSRWAICVGRNNVKQVTGDAGIGEMRGDARAHGSGTQDSDFIDALHNQALLADRYKPLNYRMKWWTSMLKKERDDSRP